MRRRPRTSPRRRLRVTAASLSLLVASACYDPVHADAVAALGDEDPAIPRGPTHRAGQPCTTCHGGNGPAARKFSVAGTIYRYRGLDGGLAGASVRVFDARDASIAENTKENGNFYVSASEYAPVFPLRVEVTFDGGITARMVTKMGREGGCAACHRGKGDAQSMPDVYLEERAP
jgi:cytochrome c553